LLIMSNTAILMPNWIGDFVVALAVVLHKSWVQPPTLLVPRHLVDLAEALAPHLPRLCYARRDRAEFYQSVAIVRDAHFESLYLLPLSLSSAWFGFKTGIPRRRGLNTELRGLLLTQTLRAAVRNHTRHLIEEYAAVLETEPFDPEKWEGRVIRSAHDFSDCTILCPGALFGPAKQWQGFGRLAALLGGQRIVILGTAADQTIAAGIMEQVPAGITNLCGETTLPEAAAIIAAARVMVSNDSGLMHVAGFLGTPVVALFGSTAPAWTRPLGKAAIAYTGEPCSPCFSRTCRYKHYRCLTAIMPESVAALVREMPV
jgi:heptosyltransferase-2